MEVWTLLVVWWSRRPGARSRRDFVTVTAEAAA
jgi:hypothetical protein